MPNDIFVVVEYKDGGIRKVSLELLSKARQVTERLGSTLYAVVMGHAVTELAAVLRKFSNKVIVVDHEELENYRWDTFTSVLEKLAEKYKPFMVLGGSTVTGKDLFPRVAARLKGAIVSDAVGMELDGTSVRIKKPLYGGKIVSWVSCKENLTAMITFRPNSFAVENHNLTGELIEESVDPSRDPRITVTSIDKGGSKKVDIQEADFIICGGRGMKGPENFDILESIADLMGGRVGASRAVVDSKWRDYDDQVGKSGKTVSPKLYIGCGVSGALHHTMGMDTSKVIVAVNKDPNAPIFSYADYGIVDDLFTVLPILKKELEQAKEET